MTTFNMLICYIYPLFANHASVLLFFASFLFPILYESTIFFKSFLNDLDRNYLEPLGSKL